MKKTAKIICLLLSAVLLCSFPSPAAAADSQGILCIVPHKYNSLRVPETADPDIDWTGVAAAVEAGIRSFEPSIDLSAFSINTNNAANIDCLTDIVCRTPRLLNNCENVSFSYDPATGRLYSLMNRYIYTKEQYSAMYTACEDAITSLLYGIRDNVALSDAQKCLLVHDRLIQWCEYDYENYLADTIPDESYSAYGALVCQRCVCQGYAAAFEWMMDELGIPCAYVSSDTINHGWNMVTIDGKDYFIDVTWDDVTRDVPGYVLHTDLLTSFDTFKSGHRGASDYTHSPVSTLYENEYWRNIKSEIVSIDGAFYYIEKAPGNDYYAYTHVELKKRLPNGTETVLKTLESEWTTPQGDSVYGSDNARLTAIGDELIYSLADEIRSYNVKTGEDKTLFVPDLSGFASGYHIYGFTQRNGTVYVTVSDSTDYDENTKKDNTFSYAFCTEHADRELLYTVSEPVSGTGGTGKYICRDCRAVFTDKIPDCEHDFGEWLTDTAATCVKAGSEKRVCAKCGAAETRTTVPDKNNHASPVVSLEAKQPDCEHGGHTEELRCPVCGTVLTASVTLPAKGHSEVTDEAKEPTCTETGLTEGKHCSVCEKILIAQKILDALGHKMTKTEERAATCTEAGCNAYYTCSVCEKVFKDEAGNTETTIEAETVPAKGHIWADADCSQPSVCTVCHTVSGTAIGHHYVGEVTAAPTCTDTGVMTYICSRCPDTYTEEIAATGHTEAAIPAAEATCTETGRTAGVKCSVCEAVLAEPKNVPAKGHTETEILAVEATCTETGLTAGVKCSVCEEILIAQEIVPAKGHTDADGDNYCEVCDMDIYAPQSNCACDCHKTGFLRFLFKLKIILYRVFKLEQYIESCPCGEAHW